MRATWQPNAATEARSDTSWDAAWRSGAEMSLDDALELARATTKICEPG
jgi:hypothetical protein